MERDTESNEEAKTEETKVPPSLELAEKKTADVAAPDLEKKIEPFEHHGNPGAVAIGGLKLNHKKTKPKEGTAPKAQLQLAAAVDKEEAEKSSKNPPAPANAASKKSSGAVAISGLNLNRKKPNPKEGTAPKAPLQLAAAVDKADEPSNNSPPPAQTPSNKMWSKEAMKRSNSSEFWSSDEISESMSTSPPTAYKVEATLVKEEPDEPVDRLAIEEEIRKEFLKNTVVGQATVVIDNEKEEEEEPSSQKRWFCVVLVGLLIIGIVIAITVGVGGPEDPVDPMETSSPTSAPSPAPTIAPTVNIANLDNSKIEEAHPLLLGATALVNAGENFQEIEFSVSTAACDFRRRDLAISREFVDGLWYTYQPKQSGPVTAVLCGGINYQIKLFSENVHVVCSESQRGDLGICGGDSVSWFAQEDKEYYLLVNSGFFDGPRQDETFTVAAVDNDLCPYAYGPVVPTSAGIVLPYTTTSATLTADESLSCGGSVAGGGPGVWYLVEGTGRPLTASTCSAETNFKTQISVFSGDCGNLFCVNGNKDSCGLGSEVTWPSQEGEFYLVLVQGASTDATGDFELTLLTDADRKENDFCATAKPKPETDSFTFAGSTADDVPKCDGSNEKENIPFGIWYRVDGNGEEASFAIGMPDEAPIEIRLLKGSNCGNLVCVENADVGFFAVGGFSTTGYIFPTELGETYYIYLGMRDRANIDVSYVLGTDPF